ncbi:hypothetical protein PPL_08015 [Heterostelium album PN500]|uniref:Uncharacterized protein n=1 Tax=Heterostelium pallidum (strain ATCC 26659 / Pp 5 / PN500) TaxID=670386 RepID=D3BHL2_HETP5|nr:hypothetical protein PPL_08015 [Heterostelium album PN500]EFA79189.1 hypothetical protein PPL_08015 [Heterostelium album PN500]|eukprot:XP_020431310.1 hypothetical protein PPL_08015 [Heterostelium album PN500]
MDKIFVANLNQKRQFADLVYCSPERLNNAEINEITQWLRSELNIRGQERVKNDLRGFLKSVPAHSYAKFQVKLEHDAHVLNVGGGGCLGYVSDYIIDYYDTLEFSNIEIYTPVAPVTIEHIKEKFQIATLYQIKSSHSASAATPSTTTQNHHTKTHNTHSTHSQSQATVSSPSNSSSNNQYVAKYTPRTPVVKTKTALISPQILGTKA